MKANSPIRCLLSLTVLLASLAPLSAAGGTPEGIDPEIYDYLAGTVDGRSRALVFTGLGKQVVQNPSVTPAGLAYREGPHDPWRTIPWSELAKIEVRKSHAQTGALIGGTILGAGGLALGVASTRECSGWLDFTCDFSTGDVLVVTALGFGTGALIGGLIGALVTNWKPVYECSPSSPALGFSTLSGGGGVITVSILL